MKSKRRDQLKFFLRLAIGLALLVYLLKSADGKDLLAKVVGIHIGWVLVAVVVIVALRVVMSIRWQDVLRLQDIHVGLWELIRITFISMFFGHFLPGGVGTDVVRGYELISRRGKTADVTATLILDRFIGVYSMFSVALIGAIIGSQTGRLEGMVWPLIGAQFLILGGWVFGLFVSGWLEKANWFSGTKLEKIWGKLLLVLRSITDFGKIRSIFLKVFILSVAVQLGRCLLFYSLYHALGEAVTYVDCVTIIPLVYVIVLIPISVGGLGVREGTLTFMFKPLGVPPEISISVGLISHVLQILVAVPGLFFWLFDRKDKPNHETHEKEE